jgi:hypothetical protein
LIVARFERDLLDDLGDKLRYLDCEILKPLTLCPRFLLGDRRAELNVRRIVGLHFGADAVLERCDDLSACGVVFRICAKDEQYVERQSDGISFDLHVALLHDVEKSDLDLARRGPAAR